jgi:3-oxoacyl-[acyl-carrier protein] reductase
MSNKTAVVTGASRGIARAAAIELANAGVVVGLVARDVAALEATAAAISANGGNARIFPCDISAPFQVIEMEQAVAQSLGSVDILVNAAAVITPIGPIAESDVTEWTDAVSTNLFGQYHVTRAFLPGLIARQGVILCMNAVTADVPINLISAFNVAKAGFKMLSRCINLEYGATGLKIYDLRAGLAATKLRGIAHAHMSELNMFPPEVIPGPEDAGKCVAYLCLERPDDLVGQTLDIDDETFRARVGLEGTAPYAEILKAALASR